MFKVIQCDNFARESSNYPERDFTCLPLSEARAGLVAQLMNAHESDQSPYFYRVKPWGYRCKTYLPDHDGHDCNGAHCKHCGEDPAIVGYP